MCQRVAQFSAFAYGCGRLRRVVTRYASGEGKLLEQFPHSLFVLLNARIKLRIGAFKIGIRHHTGSSVSRTANVNSVEIVLLEQAVEMHVDKVYSGRRT